MVIMNIMIIIVSNVISLNIQLTQQLHGISEYVGSIEPGKLADIVLWDPIFFGVKP